jgi:transposase
MLQLKIRQEVHQENKISMLNWSGNSPDMNPIETLWTIVKKRLGKMDCSTEELNSG